MTDVVRTPDECFEGLPDWPFEPHYTEVDGLRMHYVDEGPADGPPLVLLHGQPTWSYLYRHMIPVLTGAGARVIAPDLVGMGRSDKPVALSAYSYLAHVAWVRGFLDALSLRDVNLFVQDWGSLIGLRVLGDDPSRVARLIVANGQLPNLPEGFTLFPPPASLDDRDDLALPFGHELPWHEFFPRWVEYSLRASQFRPSQVMSHLTQRPLSAAELAAYDAPFPTREHMAAVRTFPSLINTVGEAPTNAAASAALDAFEKPVLTLFGRRDPNLGGADVQARFTSVPGAAGQPHHAYDDAGHFVQEDVGADLARRVAEFMAAT